MDVMGAYRNAITFYYVAVKALNVNLKRQHHNQLRQTEHKLVDSHVINWWVLKNPLISV